MYVRERERGGGGQRGTGVHKLPERDAHVQAGRQTFRHRRADTQTGRRMCKYSMCVRERRTDRDEEAWVIPPRLYHFQCE